MKMHTAQSGLHQGELVQCTAEKACRISSDSEHMHFDNVQDAREYSELKMSEENGGPFGGGIGPVAKARLEELEATSEKLKVESGVKASVGAVSVESPPARPTSSEIEAQEKAEIKEIYAKVKSAEQKMYAANDELSRTGFGDEDEYLNAQDTANYYERLVKNGQKLVKNRVQVLNLVNRGKRPQYIESIDNKHFDSSRPGSTFTDERVSKTEDVLKEVVAQRGGLGGDDREKLIAAGADPKAFLPKESGVRYLQVKLNGTQALKDTKDLREDEVLTISAKGGNDGRPASLSFAYDVKETPKTDFATVVVGPDMDENKKPIPNTEVLWTLHPGKPTRGIRSDDIRSKGLDNGSKVTVKQLREMFGKDIQVNTRNI